MKKLEELGISPVPWRQEANGYGTLDVLGYDDSLVVAYENPINKHDQENRRLIAAAPKLYDAAERLMFAYNRCEVKREHIIALCSALAEAAGESEVPNG